MEKIELDDEITTEEKTDLDKGLVSKESSTHQDVVERVDLCTSHSIDEKGRWTESPDRSYFI